MKKSGIDFIGIIEKKYGLSEIDAGEFAKFNVGPMKFTVRAYDAKGFGRVSKMDTTAFFGLMKMQTVIIVPIETDLPLLSYDRIKAMGNDKLYLELYDTLSGEFEPSKIDDVKKKYASLADFDAGEHWYDSLRLSQSVFKSAKSKESEKIDGLAEDFFESYLESVCEGSPDISIKKKKTEDYVSGLLKNGGPSTDAMKKRLGDEKTEKLFKNLLFGTSSD